MSRGPSSAQALAATGIFATPLLIWDENRVLGYRPEELVRVLLSCSRCFPESRE